MSIFSKLRSHKSVANSNDEIYKQIFTNISNSDEKVRAEIEKCLENIRLYSLKNSDKFEERGLDISKDSEYTLKWFGCIDILIDNGYAAEFDYKTDFEDFYDLLGKLKIVSQRGILPSEDDIYLDYEPNGWLSCIDSRWAKAGLCVGGIDIDSDSYVIFICTVEQLDKLSKLASESGRKICRAREL